MPAASRVSQLLATRSEPKYSPSTTLVHSCSKKANLSRLARNSVGGPSSLGSALRSKALSCVLGWSPGFLGLLPALLEDRLLFDRSASDELALRAALLQNLSRNEENSDPLEVNAMRAVLGMIWLVNRDHPVPSDSAGDSSMSKRSLQGSSWQKHFCSIFARIQVDCITEHGP